MEARLEVSMPAHEENYKDHQITIEEPEEGEPRLLINDQEANTIKNADGTYSSESLFYAKYASLRHLARAEIDQRSKE